MLDRGRHARLNAVLGLLLGCAMACNEAQTDSEGPPPMVLSEGLTVLPGEGIGVVRIGMQRDELYGLLGEPDVQVPFQRLINARYLKEGLEVLLTSSDPVVATTDARVRSVSTLPTGDPEGDWTHGMSRTILEDSLGPPTMEDRGVLHFTGSGLAVELDEQQEAVRFAVWPAYESAPTPPEMRSAVTDAQPLPATDQSGAAPQYEYEGVRYDVVDMHLHVGTVESQQPTGVAFLLAQLPKPVLLYFPATSGLVLHPYGEHLGIQQHLKAAGVGHGVLLATYTHHTIGFAENRLLESFLSDPRNSNEDGTRWAWGMASINFDDFDAPGIADKRLAALSTYFEKRPDVFIGIKLAHAHQAVSFDDPLYLGVYDIAALYGVPVLLHTGFSPFPNSMHEEEYYDPASLEAVVTAYDGHHGLNRVDFVLAHTGQGDARAIEHSLQLAEKHDNVWLELSAINRPLLIDADGQAVASDEPMHSFVLSQILERGLVGRTLFATDGPQYFGKTQSYLKLMVSTMASVGYSPDEIQAVLADNFYSCFQPPLH